MERLSLFVISIILASMGVVAFGLFYTGIGTTYNVTNNVNLSAYNQMAGITNITNSMHDKIIAQPTSTGGFNVPGDFLSYGYNSLRLTFTSFDYFFTMLDFAFTNNLASSSIFIKLGIGSIVLIILAYAIFSLLTQRTQL